MRVRFQYADWTVWEGSPEDAHESPDPRPPEGGVIKMTLIHDEQHVDGGRKMNWVYDDLYYFWPIPGGWRFGSGIPSREYEIMTDHDTNCDGYEVPLQLPKNAIIRYGCTVSDEEAKKFGLIPPNSDYKLHPKVMPPIELIPPNAARFHEKKEG